MGDGSLRSGHASSALGLLRVILDKLSQHDFALLLRPPPSILSHPLPEDKVPPGLVLDNNTKETTIDVDLDISVSRSVLPCADRDTSFEEALVLRKLKRVRYWYWARDLRDPKTLWTSTTRVCLLPCQV